MRRNTYSLGVTRKTVGVSLIACFTTLLFAGHFLNTSGPQEIKTEYGVIKNSTAFAGATDINRVATASLSVKENSVTTVALAKDALEEENYTELEQTDDYTVDTSTVKSNVPNHESACKSDKFTYMDYKKITCKSSKQYWVVNDELAYTDEDTKLRMYDGEYLVAIAQGYGYIPGDNLLVIFESGKTQRVVVGEMKATQDCDKNEKYQATDGSVIEFLVDGISSCEEFNANKPENFSEKIIAIQKIEG